MTMIPYNHRIHSEYLFRERRTEEQARQDINKARALPYVKGPYWINVRRGDQPNNVGKPMAEDVYLSEAEARQDAAENHYSGWTYDHTIYVNPRECTATVLDWRFLVEEE